MIGTNNTLTLTKGLSVWQLPPSEPGRELIEVASKTGVTVLGNIIIEVVSCPLWHVLLVRSKSQGLLLLRMTEWRPGGRGRGHHLRAYPPYQMFGWWLKRMGQVTDQRKDWVRALGRGGRETSITSRQGTPAFSEASKQFRFEKRSW